MRTLLPLGLLSAAALLATSGGARAAITMALGEPTGGTRTDTYPIAGYGFYLPATTTVAVNRLGFWDQGGDGLINAHTVSLFRYIGGSNKSYTQLASIVIPAGTAAALEGGYRWVEIPELSLAENGQNGNYYVIMATQGGDPWTNGIGSPMNTAFGTLSTGALDFGGGVNGDEINSSVTLFGGANFGHAIPEPSIALVAGISAIGFGLRRSRKIG